EWSALAAALAQADQGDGTLLLQQSDLYTERDSSGTYKPLLSANTAVNCIDRPWPKDPAAYDAQAARFAADAPHFGAALAYGGLVCADWHYPPVDTPHALVAAGSPPILVVGTTGDPATPYAWAQAVAK